MSTSLLPFLYQTQTIQQRSSALLPAALALARTAHLTTGNISSSRTKTCDSRGLPAQFRLSSTKADYGAGKRPRGRPKSTGKTTGKEAAAGTETKTGFKTQKTRVTARTTKPDPSDVLFESLPDMKDSRRIHMPPNSTLTAAEQAKFNDIFTEIGVFDRKPKLGSVVTAATSNPDPESDPGFDLDLGIRDPVQSTRSSTQDDAIRTEQLSESDNSSGSMQERAVSVREDFLSRYPPAVQSVARDALGMHEGLLPNRGSLSSFGPSGSMITATATATKTTTTTVAFGPVSEGDDSPKTPAGLEKATQIEAQRAIEISRIEALMRKCSTDVSLWKVLEKEVFAIPEELESGLKNISRPSEKATNVGQPAVAVGESAFTMDVHGAVYSVLLCAACHRFANSFSSLSPFAFQLLPHIKSLGMASYALGASTTLYNETMRLYWSHHGDLQAVIDLLDEMDGAGLNPDHETHEFLDKLSKLLDLCQAKAESSGNWLTFMMRMPGYQGDIRSRLDDWLARTQNELHQGISQDVD